MYIEKPTVVLMGLDSLDGKGDRAILPEPRAVYKPLLTADGKRVVFWDNVANAIFVVAFDGGGLRKVADGELHDVWTDPQDGVEWIYASIAGGPYTVRYAPTTIEVEFP